MTAVSSCDVTTRHHIKVVNVRNRAQFENTVPLQMFLDPVCTKAQYSNRLKIIIPVIQLF
jgi:hypothetical protein